MKTVVKHTALDGTLLGFFHPYLSWSSRLLPPRLPPPTSFPCILPSSILPFVSIWPFTAIQDRISHPAAPFYVGVTVESLHIESTDQRWEAQPVPLSGPIISSRGGVATAGEYRNTVDQSTTCGDPPKTDAAAPLLEGRTEGGAAGDDDIPKRLVKKELQLNHLAVYWNPAEDGNPCSMHLSDIPVEQAEVVISRSGIRHNDFVGGTEAEERVGGWRGYLFLYLGAEFQPIIAWYTLNMNRYTGS